MEQKTSFFRNLDSAGRRAIACTYYSYFLLGAALILFGSLLPAIRAEYELSFRFGGLLLSMMSVGYLIAGLVSNWLGLRLGMKRALMLLFNLIAIGLLILVIVGQPYLLLGAMLLIGFSKGAITNYNNQITSVLSGGDAAPLNLLHACFAIGACLAPIVVLLVGIDGDSSAWRTAFYIVLLLCVVGFVLQLRLKSLPEQNTAARGTNGFGFLGERLFWLCIFMMFFYQTIESSFMGWMVSFFLESGVIGASLAQLLNTTFWIALLMGRVLSAAAAARFQPRSMLLAMSGGITLFFTMLMLCRSAFGISFSAFGLGFAMSGMYGTLVANSGSVFSRYPLSMGVFVAIPAIGQIAAPYLIGLLADTHSLQQSMLVLFVSVALLLAGALVNFMQYKTLASHETNVLPEIS